MEKTNNKRGIKHKLNLRTGNIIKSHQTTAVATNSFCYKIVNKLCAVAVHLQNTYTIGKGKIIRLD